MKLLPFVQPLQRLPALIVVLVSAVLAAGPAAGQEAEVTLRGFVIEAETGRPLIGANVRLLRIGAPDEPARGAVVGSEGYYQIPGLAPGRYALRVSFVGYRTFRDSLLLRQELVTRNVQLQATELALDEVTVAAENQAGAADLEAGLQTIEPEDLDRIPTPAASGDLAMYLQTLPGVVSLGDRGGGLYVRGGAPSHNLVLMDGILIYRPFHIIGFFSVFPQDLVSSADFYAGGFPARYTGRLSAVLDVKMRGGNHEHFAAAVGASPLAASVQVEGPIQRGTSSFLVSARRSLIESTAPFLLGQQQPLYFEEQFAKYQRIYRLGRCSVTALHTYDRGKVDPERSALFEWSNYAIGGRCVQASPSSSVLVELRLGVSGMNNAVGAGEGPERYSSAWRFQNGVDLTIPREDGSELRVGFHVGGGQWLNHELHGRFRGVRAEDVFFITNGIYGGAELPLMDGRLTLEPSLGLYGPLGYMPSLEPRLRASWRPWGSEAQELSAAVGLYHQLIQGISDERDAGAVFTAWMLAPVDSSRAQALHAILGWQQQVGRFSFVAEGYYKRLRALPVPIWSNRARFTTELDLANGTIYGFDTRLEYEQESFYAYLGYQWSWTRYEMQDQLLGVGLGNPVQSYHPPHDRRHSLNAVLQTDLAGATASLRWQFGSGLPYTPALGFDNLFDLRRNPSVQFQFGEPRFLFDKPYHGRLPTYHRLDVSLERSFELNTVDVTATIGAVNVYNRRNIFYYDLFTFKRVDQLPLVPYLALHVATH